MIDAEFERDQEKRKPVFRKIALSVRWSVAMRRFLLAAVMLGAVSDACAADLPDFLRGSYSPPAPVRNWDGWYAGGQVGYSSASSDFSQSVVGLTNFIFRSSILEDPVSKFSL